MYGCHRTTAMRWIGAATDVLLSKTRSRLIEQLRVTESECDRIFGLVRSRFDVTLSALFETPNDG